MFQKVLFIAWWLTLDNDANKVRNIPLKLNKQLVENSQRKKILTFTYLERPSSWNELHLIFVNIFHFSGVHCPIFSIIVISSILKLSIVSRDSSFWKRKKKQGSELLNHWMRLLLQICVKSRIDLRPNVKFHKLWLK